MYRTDPNCLLEENDLLPISFVSCEFERKMYVYCLFIYLRPPDPENPAIYFLLVHCVFGFIHHFHAGRFSECKPRNINVKQKSSKI